MIAHRTCTFSWESRVCLILLITAKPENGATLPLVLLRCLLAPFMAAILPRVSVIVFRFAQPLLISRAIRFVTQSSVEDHDRSGYWIVVAAASIYIGMAVNLFARLNFPKRRG